MVVAKLEQGKGRKVVGRQTFLEEGSGRYALCCEYVRPRRETESPV